MAHLLASMLKEKRNVAVGGWWQRGNYPQNCPHYFIHNNTIIHYLVTLIIALLALENNQQRFSFLWCRSREKVSEKRAGEIK
jgi:hypothetical protein